MRITKLHSWDVTPAQARALQESLAGQVDVRTPMRPYETLAAADVSFNKFDPWLYAAVVVVRTGTFEVVDRAGVAAKVPFPYIPGLLSFREAPAVLDAFEKLRVHPDVVICDGQGIAHPRRLGLAAHLGLWLGLPTVGCAKSLLCGRYEEPGPDRGDRSPLVDRGEVVGMVVRTRPRVKPIFVSPGHLCDLEGAVAMVLAVTGKYRLPVPSRMAHEFVNEVRRSVGSGRPIPE